MNRFYRTTLYPKYQLMLLGLIETLEGLLKVFTFGWFGANYSFLYMSKMEIQYLAKLNKD